MGFNRNALTGCALPQLVRIDWMCATSVGMHWLDVCYLSWYALTGCVLPQLVCKTVTSHQLYFFFNRKLSVSLSTGFIGLFIKHPSPQDVQVEMEVYVLSSNVKRKIKCEYWLFCVVHINNLLLHIIRSWISHKYTGMFLTELPTARILTFRDNPDYPIGIPGFVSLAVLDEEAQQLMPDGSLTIGFRVRAVHSPWVWIFTSSV